MPEERIWDSPRILYDANPGTFYLGDELATDSLITPRGEHVGEGLPSNPVYNNWLFWKWELIVDDPDATSMYSAHYVPNIPITLTFDSRDGHFVNHTSSVVTKTILPGQTLTSEMLLDVRPEIDGGSFLGWALIIKGEGVTTFKPGLIFPMVMPTPFIHDEITEEEGGQEIFLDDIENYVFWGNSTLIAIYNTEAHDITFNARGNVTDTLVDFFYLNASEEALSEVTIPTDFNGHLSATAPLPQYRTRDDTRARSVKYEFKGYYQEDDPSVIYSADDLADMTFISNATLYAYWEEIAIIYGIFDASPGTFTTGDKILSVKVEDGGRLAAPSDPSLANHEFIGWTNVENGDTPIDISELIITETTTFYAIWKPNNPLITFDPDGGILVTGSGAVSVYTNDEGKIISPPADPVKDGYTFEGWSTNPGGPDVINLETTVFPTDQTLYAVWEKIIYITFSSNGGYFQTGTTKRVLASDGKVIPPTEAPLRNGYIFKGYGLAEDSKTVINFNTEVFEDSATVYAVWKLIVIATFNSDGGSFPTGAEITTVTANEAGRVSPPQNPVKNGYRFKGWSKIRGGTTAINFEAEVFEEIVTLWAIWEMTYTSTISFGFYDSMDGDRRYDANDISTLFDGVIPEGIYVTQNHYMEVIPATQGLRVLVRSGRAYLDHTWCYNNGDMQFTLAAPHRTYKRKDAIVIEVNRKLRVNSIKLLTGTPSANPQNPVVSSDPLVKQYVMAIITVSPGDTIVKQSQISIQTGLTIPFVLGVMQYIPIATYTAQYAKWYKKFTDWLQGNQKIVNKGTFDEMVGNISHKVDIYEDKATSNTPITDNTKYITSWYANNYIVNGFYKKKSIYITADIKNGSGWTQSINTVAYSINDRLCCDLFWFDR